MQPLTQSEELLIRELFEKSIEKSKIDRKKINEIEKLSGDVSTRKYYRLFCAGSNYVVCIDSPENLNKKDFNFISTQEVFKKSNVKVPEIYDVRVERGYVIMQDLGDETLLTNAAVFGGLEEEVQTYKKIVEELVSIHKIQPASFPDHSVATKEFDFEKFNWEMNFTHKNLINGYIGLDNPAYVNELDQLFRPVINKVLELPKLVVHRDFHSRNIMYSDGEYYIIDFQDARQGPIQYDLVSLLEDAYYSLQRTSRYEIQQYFHQRLIDEKLVNMDFDEFLVGYDHCAIQRIYKAIGTFCFILNERKDARYVRYVHACFERLKSILFKYEEYSELRKKLSNVYYGY